jgi:methyltransferase (TIGR00027 family)
MSERAESSTAAGVATLRAAHQLLDGEPKILDDPIAVRLLDPGTLERIRREPELFAHPGALALRSHVVLRSRFTEDRLAEAVGRGVGQYVVLGAGFDTFAYRQPEWAHGLRLFEVDHPASQRAKVARLTAAGVALPANLELVPIDFEHVTIEEGMARSGFDPRLPALFSWLGVTMYLTLPAIDAVLSFVAALPPGTEVVLTFAHPDAPDTPGGRLAAAAAALGEPWISRFTSGELAQRLYDHGFSHVAFLRPPEATDRYFRGRTDALLPPRRSSLVSAIV